MIRFSSTLFVFSLVIILVNYLFVPSFNDYLLPLVISLSVFWLSACIARYYSPKEAPDSSESAQQGMASGSKIAKKLNGTVGKNAISAASVSFLADKLRTRVENKTKVISAIADNVLEITSNIQLVNDASSRSVATAINAKETCINGQSVLSQGVDGMRRVNSQTEASLNQIEALDTRVRKIQDVTSVIEEIASQTNLLALNAAIEAARAGENGRGFAVVADEVRHLAARTSDSTDEVGAIISEILKETQKVVEHIQTLSKDVEAGTQGIEKVGELLSDISNQNEASEKNILDISHKIENSMQRLEEISVSIESARDESANSQSEVDDLSSQAESLMSLAEESNAILAECSSESYHQKFYKVARAGRDRIQQLLESALTENKISENELFDKTLGKIPNTDPAKYHSKFDALCDEILPDVQESIVSNTDEVVFAITCDTQGYVPTHNNRFAQPLTGDREVDMVNNRTKRLFDDRTGIRCGSHTQEMLLQTYKRDTGEIMHDLSMPIYIRGKHWGGFRLGYLPDVEAN